MRALARDAGVAASTILRRVRKLEQRRDDPLVDRALNRLGRQAAIPHDTQEARMTQQPHVSPQAGGASVASPAPASAAPATPANAGLAEGSIAACDAPTADILRALSRPRACLAVALDMDRAVVVRESAQGAPEHLAVTDRTLAEGLALRGWIACDDPTTRVARYRITPEGRQILRQADRDAGKSDRAAAPRCARGTQVESPIQTLGRRRGRDGAPFLDADLVGAGERLREDFELAQMGPRTTQNWDHFLTAGTQSAPASGAASGPGDARDRVARALADLGPGLADVALRCCCYQEGMEAAERRMGWSARSGKVVLRIALQRLRLFYARQSDGQMIG